MIDFKNVYKSFGEQEILINANFRININERVGIVGPNGAGKTTIFNLIVNNDLPDKGNIDIPKDKKISLLSQHINLTQSHKSILEYTSNAIPELNEILDKIHKIEFKLKKDAHNQKQLALLGNLQTKYENLGGYTIANDAEKALSGLGFSTKVFSQPLDSFSGGWQMRAALIKALISKPDILLLDEPSNYLDIPAIEWLHKYLKNYQGTILLISHDRYLLRKLTNITIEINNGQVQRYPGDYDFYVRERDARLDQLKSTKNTQDRKIKHMEDFITRFRSKNTKAALVKSQIKKLDKIEKVSLPDSLHYSGTIRIPTPPKLGTEVLSVNNIAFKYNNNDEMIIESANLQIIPSDKIGLVGFNGTGKTTFMKLLAGVLTPTKGNISVRDKVLLGYQPQDFSEIFSDDQRVIDVIRNASPDKSTDKDVRQTLGSFGFSGEDVNKLCSVLSGGEKIRLSFARIFINPPNFLILDEPTTHLDIAAREGLQEALRTYKGTVCIVSHDIEFLQGTATTIIAMQSPGIKKYYGGYNYYIEKLKTEIKRDETVFIETDKEELLVNNKKQERKEKALARQSVQKEKNQLKQKIDKIENRLEVLEDEQTNITKELIVDAKHPNFADLNKRYKTNSIEIKKISNEWEIFASEYENII